MQKAQVSNQFNWLFVAIAGGVILLFFLFIITQMQAAGEAKLQAVVLGNMDAILTGSQVSPNTLNRIESTGRLQFDITCRDGNSRMSVPSTFSEVDLARKIIFTPGSIGSQELYIYVIPIDSPMRVDNAIHFSDSRMFFLVFNASTDSRLQAAYNAIPEGIPKASTAIIEDRVRSYNKIIITSNSAPPATLAYPGVGYNNLLRMEANWITINNSGYYIATKTARDNNFGVSEKVAEPGANPLHVMFSKDKEFYLCTMEKLKERIQIVAKIHETRARNIATYELPSTDPCINPLNDAANNFGDLYINPTDTTAISNLQSINEQLIRLGCPTAY